MKQAVALVLVGLGFAGGMVATMSCTSERGEAHERNERLAAQGHGEKGEKAEKKEKGENGEKGEKDEDEQVIPFAQAPNAVRTAMLKLTTENDVKKVERASDDDIVSFEIEYMADGEKRSATMTDKGEILELEHPAKSLPEAVKAAIAKAMPDGKMGNGESVQLFYYEVAVTTKDGKKGEVKVFANGKFVDEDED
jgi:hypothetical protein